jgi:hypothetical protein
VFWPVVDFVSVIGGGTRLQKDEFDVFYGDDLNSWVLA